MINIPANYELFSFLCKRIEARGFNAELVYAVLFLFYEVQLTG
jgi:hypothetical protein